MPPPWHSDPARYISVPTLMLFSSFAAKGSALFTEAPKSKAVIPESIANIFTFFMVIPLTFIFCHFQGGLTNKKRKALLISLSLDTPD